MSYSSYLNQEQMMERINLLELTLALLINNTVSGSTDPDARATLLHFSDHIEEQRIKRSEAPGS